VTANSFHPEVMSRTGVKREQFFYRADGFCRFREVPDSLPGARCVTTDRERLFCAPAPEGFTMSNSTTTCRGAAIAPEPGNGDSGGGLAPGGIITLPAPQVAPESAGHQQIKDENKTVQEN